MPHSKQHALNRDVPKPHDGHISCDLNPAILWGFQHVHLVEPQGREQDNQETERNANRSHSAAMLADSLAGENPARGTCPVATVAIFGDGAGDQSVGKPGSKSPGRLGEAPSQIRQGGRTNRQVVADANRNQAPKWFPPGKRMVGISEVPKPLGEAEGQRCRRRNWVHAADELPGVSEDDVPRRTGQRKHGTTRGSPRRNTYSEDISYKPQGGEIEVCRRVGRMGSIKCCWTGTE